MNEPGPPTLEYNPKALLIPFFVIILGFAIIFIYNKNSLGIVIGSLIAFAGIISTIAVGFIMIQLRASEARLRREYMLRKFEEEEEEKHENKE